jgi:hypothetical protein
MVTLVMPIRDRANGIAGMAVRFGALASHLTDTHIVFVQGRRTQGFAVLSWKVTPTHRYPELALSGRGVRRLAARFH